MSFASMHIKCDRAASAKSLHGVAGKSLNAKSAKSLHVAKCCGLHWRTSPEQCMQVFANNFLNNSPHTFALPIPHIEYPIVVCTHAQAPLFSHTWHAHPSNSRSAAQPPEQAMHTTQYRMNTICCGVRCTVMITIR